jgi:hypothetical protein
MKISLHSSNKYYRNPVTLLDWVYRCCYTSFIPSTGGTQTSGQATFYPQHGSVPKETAMDEAQCIATKLVQAVHHLRDEQIQQPGRHTVALQKFSCNLPRTHRPNCEGRHPCHTDIHYSNCTGKHTGCTTHPSPRDP